MKSRKQKEKIDFTKCSKLTIFLKIGLNIKSDITFDFDGDNILLVSLMDGKNIGYLKVNKKDEDKLKKWIKLKKKERR